MVWLLALRVRQCVPSAKRRRPTRAGQGCPLSLGGGWRNRAVRRIAAKQTAPTTPCMRTCSTREPGTVSSFIPPFGPGHERWEQIPSREWSAGRDDFAARMGTSGRFATTDAPRSRADFRNCRPAKPIAAAGAGWSKGSVLGEPRTVPVADELANRPSSLLPLSNPTLNRGKGGRENLYTLPLTPPATPWSPFLGMAFKKEPGTVKCGLQTPCSKH
jgi:hypothetical protein